jgi:hypothetical protein
VHLLQENNEHVTKFITAMNVTLTHVLLLTLLAPCLEHRAF